MPKDFTSTVEESTVELTGFSDPNTSGQWYFDRPNQSEMSINVESVWEDYTGSGIVVAVMDSIINNFHPDLDDNYDSSLDYHLGENTDDFDWDSVISQHSHGTAVAGVIAAEKDNGFGGMGIAYDATITNYAMDFSSSDVTSQVLMGINLATNVDVLNCSWSYTTAFSDKLTIGSDGYNALVNAVENGRDGLGTVIVFAAGNEGGSESSNYHGYQNSPFTIAVGSVDSEGEVSGFSSLGSNLLLSAPGEDILTSWAYGSVREMNGTSFAAPAVSAAAALILDANEDLGYRDVMEILALSARADQLGTDSRVGLGWVTNGADNFNGGGMHYSDSYGYGYLNVHDAVRLAETWEYQQTYATLRTETVSLRMNEVMTAGENDHLRVEIEFTEDMEIESAQLSMRFAWFHSNDLEVYLTSPDGTVSQLVYDYSTVNGGGGFTNFPFTTNALLGELARGTWTLDIYNTNPDALLTNGSGPMSAALRGVELSVYGSDLEADDVYYFNDEFANGYYDAEDLADRSTVTDTDGGRDSINLAMTTTGNQIDLSGERRSHVGGQTIVIEPDTIENAFGGDGNDTLFGSEDDNFLSGGRGNDTFYISGGDDTIEGGQGNDTLVFDFDSSLLCRATQSLDNFFGFSWYQNQSVTIEYITGIENFVFTNIEYTLEQLLAELGDAVVTPPVIEEPETPVETPEEPVVEEPAVEEPVVETPVEEDPIVEEPEDTPTPPDATDAIYGTLGSDTLLGDRYANEFYGDAGDDTIRGRAGSDTIWGDEGDDRLFGDAGNDAIHGGADDDRIVGGAGNDTIWGDDGNDVLSAISGQNMLYGGDGDDRIVGGRDADTLFGGEGDDTLVASRGASSVMDGGFGSDRYVCQDGADTIILNFEAGASNRVIDFDGGMDSIIVRLGDDVSGTLVYDETRTGTHLGLEHDGVIDYFAFFTEAGVEALNQQLLFG
ncbi:S8 family serine peptidase [Pseudooceanicola sp. C21-150M6]|uniref:S8 family serine peptidase n=1 Tax=Pseudooceanicola sp. C21-150M6 TaxID=3434355 RepID=UPI003D7FA415